MEVAELLSELYTELERGEQQIRLLERFGAEAKTGTEYDPDSLCADRSDSGKRRQHQDGGVERKRRLPSYEVRAGSRNGCLAPHGRHFHSSSMNGMGQRPCA
jgi:hypothetical protein